MKKFLLGLRTSKKRKTRDLFYVLMFFFFFLLHYKEISNEFFTRSTTLPKKKNIFLYFSMEQKHKNTKNQGWSTRGPNSNLKCDFSVSWMISFFFFVKNWPKKLIVLTIFFKCGPETDLGWPPLVKRWQIYYISHNACFSPLKKRACEHPLILLLLFFIILYYSLLFFIINRHSCPHR